MAKIIVIGAGIGGISAAAHLAKAGHSVTVLEKNDQPGGRAEIFQEKGYTFDRGPSWYLMPEVFDKWFADLGFDREDYYQIIKLNPQYKVYYQDKTQLEIGIDREKNLHNIARLQPGSLPKLRAYLRQAQTKYDLAMETFLYKNADSPLDFLQYWRLLPQALQLNLFGTMQHYIERYITEPKLQQLLMYNLVFLGCSPYNAPALFSLMAHVDLNVGVYYPAGGFLNMVASMVSIAKQLGVRFEYNQPIKKINTTSGLVTSLETDIKTWQADYVVSNADYVHTEDLLSDQTMRQHSDGYWKRKINGPSAFLLYLGINRKIPELMHHTLYFTEDWQKHFSDVFNHKQWPQNPSIYINRPTATDASLAPKGHDTLMILVPVASGLADSKSLRESYGDYIIKYIEKNLNIEFHSAITVKKIVTISDFEKRYNSFEGNAFGGLAHTLFQSSIWRPSNRHKKLSNLFFTGAGTVPGIGLPTSLISGYLVNDRIAKLK